MTVTILGLSAYCPGSACALIRDGQIIAAAQEERFSRRPHDSHFPGAAIAYCLQEAGIGLDAVGRVAFCDRLRADDGGKALAAHRGIHTFVTAMPVRLKERLYLKARLRRELTRCPGARRHHLPPLVFVDHRQAHAVVPHLDDGAGGALGAALAAWQEQLRDPDSPELPAAMPGGYFGPWFSDENIVAFLDSIGATYRQLADPALFEAVTEMLARGQTVGWFQGRMAYGPEALGNRSILGDSRSSRVCAQLAALTGIDSPVSSRVPAGINPRWEALSAAFARRTGGAALIEAPLRAPGEPIVCTPADAFHSFMHTELDCLVLGNAMLLKRDQPL